MAASTSQNSPTTIDLSCPIEKGSRLRRFSRIAVKAGFWFFFLKGMAWLILAGSAVYLGTS